MRRSSNTVNRLAREVALGLGRASPQEGRGLLVPIGHPGAQGVVDLFGAGASAPRQRPLAEDLSDALDEVEPGRGLGHPSSSRFTTALPATAECKRRNKGAHLGRPPPDEIAGASIQCVCSTILYGWCEGAEIRGKALSVVAEGLLVAVAGFELAAKGL